MMKKPMSVMCLVGGCLVVCGILLSTVAWLCGAKTSITYQNGEIVLSDHGFEVGFVGTGSYHEENYITEDNGIKSMDAFQDIDIDVSTLDINIIEGNDYAIELDYKSPQKVTYEVRNDTLYVKQEPRMNRAIDRTEGSVIVCVPSGMDLSNVVLNNGLGGTEVEDMAIRKLTIDVGMGVVELNNVLVQELDIEGGMGSVEGNGLISSDTYVSVGMGSVDLEGTFTGDVKIEGGMGSITLTTTEPYETYNYKLEKGMGIITLNKNEMNNFKDFNENNGAEYTIDIEGGMGEICVYTGN